jgi:Holliday junction resolvase
MDGRGRRSKGVNGEREVAKLFESAGFDVRGLEGLGDHLVVRADGSTFHIEVKRAERQEIPAWLRQARDEAPAGTTPILAHRRNREQWYATLPLEALIALIR